MLVHEYILLTLLFPVIQVAFFFFFFLEDAMPTKNLPPNPDGVTSDAKKAYLRRIATLVVDSYIIDRHRNEKMRQSVAI